MPLVTLAQMYGFEGTLSLYIFIAGFCGLTLLAAALLRVSVIHALMGIALMCAAMTPAVNADRTQYVQTLLLPVQMNRAGFHMAVGFLLTAIVMFTGRAQFRNAPLQGWFLLAIALYAGLLQFIHDDAITAVQSIGFAMATIPCMLFASGSVAETHDGAMKTLRTTMLVSVLWTVASSMEFVANAQNVLTPQGRFFGVLANPQHAAVLVSTFAVIATWLLLNDPQRRSRLIWIALITINVLFLVWTGSRTGALMLVIGLTAVLYRRIRRAALLLPLVGGALLGLASLAEELEINKNLERLVSLENTREGVVNRFFEVLQQSPLIGVGWSDAGFSENSYLVGFSGYGILMFALMLAFLGFSMWKVFRLVVDRKSLPESERPLADIFCAFTLMYFIGAAFEGFMLGRSAAMQVLMLMFAGIGLHVTRALNAGPVDAEAESAYGASLEPA